MKEALEGTVDRIVYSNEENGWCVLSFTAPGGTITAAGVLPHVSKGSRYRLEGEWKTHPRYGEQFAFFSFEELPPDDIQSIAMFLASGTIKGIGPAMALAITRAFGKDSLRVIAEEPEKLTQVPGIGKKKAAAIVEGYREHRGFADVMMALSPYGISASVCTRLYALYGTETVSVVTEDPYRLIEDVDGIGFASADKIARAIGFDMNDPRRIAAGVYAGLWNAAEEGSTYVPEDEFVQQMAEALDVTREQVSEAAFDLVMDGKVIRELLEGMRIMMPDELYHAEQSVAGKLFALSRAELTHISGNAENMISKVSAESGIELSDQQRLAVMTSIQNGVCVITGGPGTGKTTIINTILAILDNAGVNTALAAPTGRAAKRMSQAAGQEASTLHRLLEAAYSESEGHMFFAKNSGDPLDQDCIIVDEMSMVDIRLMDALLDAVEPGTRLILVGDADQLPSVGPGSVLKDIIDSEAVPSVRLTEIFRQAAESAIIRNAHAVNRGEYPEYNGRDTDFFFMEREDPRQALELVKELCTRRLPDYFSDIDGFFDIQVLAPSKKDILGTVNLNKELQAVLNPPDALKPELSFGDKIFRLGDKVIQNKNDYSLEWRSLSDMQSRTGVFNGDIGVIHSVDKENGTVSVLYDEDRLAVYDMSVLDELDMAYALTVHKSQGCEFPVVVMPVSSFIPMLSTRNLLYTAITRARQAVVLVGRPRICSAMVDNDRTGVRCSGLAARLRRIRDFEDGQQF